MFNCFKRAACCRRLVSMDPAIQALLADSAALRGAFPDVKANRPWCGELLKRAELLGGLLQRMSPEQVQHLKKQAVTDDLLTNLKSVKAMFGRKGEKIK